jgi:chromosome segregation ATPase
MGLFKRKKDVVDLGNLHRKRQKKKEELKESFEELNNQRTGSGSSFYENNQDNSTALGFLGNMASASKDKTTSDEEYKDYSQNTQNNPSSIERKKRLANRLQKMTERIEDLSNQIYHLQQRLEVMEQKLRVNNF